MSVHDKVAYQQQVVFSRSDYARSKASKQDTDKVLDKLCAEIASELSSRGEVDADRMYALIQKKNKVASIQRKADELFNEMSEVVPAPSSRARLTSDDKQEIRRIGMSGRYTQQEIAEQFGTTQPAVSDIIRK